jgi:hypothetical protein
VIEEIVESLPGLGNVTGVRTLVDERLAAGDAAFCGDLAIAVAAVDDGRSWQYHGVFGHVLRALALTPGRSNAEQVVRIVAAGPPRLARQAAAMLAQAHPAERLAATDELRACLAHELVLRDAAVTTSPPEGHPLAWLPLTRSEIEAVADLPWYSGNGQSRPVLFGSLGDGGQETTATRGQAATETTGDPDRMAAAVVNWADESNGQFEARSFELAEPFDEELLPGTLRDLGLPCFDEAPRVQRCAPGLVWRLLFAAAANGGAYNSGAGGAYGRLHAWQSLAALAGVADDAGFPQVEAAVRDCTWYRFDTSAPWFANVAWDIGVVALSPDGMRIAVLAATDTD